MTEETKEVRVEKVVLSIGKKELILTLDEAKELKKALEGLFAKVEYYDHHWYRNVFN